MACAEIEGKFGYIDISGDFVIMPQFDNVWYFSVNGLAHVTLNGKSGFIDENGEFVSLTELNEEAVRLAALVNGHIRHCPECFELVKAFQTIYDEFLECSIENSFSQYIRENSSQLELENKAKSYLQREL